MSMLQAGMQKDILVSLTRLSDIELVTRLKGFVARERDATAEIVAHLAEMDMRDVYLREGYPSLFVYCRDALGLSEDETYNRIEVARAARRFPVILDMLAEVAVNLTAVRLLAPHLTPDNHRGVLESARGKRKSEIEEIVARLSPRPDVPPSIRKLPSPRPEPLPAAAPLLAQLPRDQTADAPCPGGGQACGLAPGPRAMRVHRDEWPSLQRASVRGVPPSGPARSGRRGDRRGDGVAVSASQRLRGKAVLREAHPYRRWRVRARGDGTVWLTAVRRSANLFWNKFESQATTTRLPA
jgi:hypothetical protein